MFWKGDSLYDINKKIEEWITLRSTYVCALYCLYYFKSFVNIYVYKIKFFNGDSIIKLEKDSRQYKWYR